MPFGKFFAAILPAQLRLQFQALARERAFRKQGAHPFRVAAAVGVGEKDVFPHFALIFDIMLRLQGKVRPRARCARFVIRLPVQQYLARRRPVDARDQFEKGRFSASVFAHDRHVFSLRQRKIYVF